MDDGDWGDMGGDDWGDAAASQEANTPKKLSRLEKAQQRKEQRKNRAGGRRNKKD